MTYEEALKMLTALDICISRGTGKTELPKALYHAIEALEKQIPKRTKISIRGTTEYNTKECCPTCGTIVSFTGKYCGECGQRLDRGD